MPTLAIASIAFFSFITGAFTTWIYYFSKTKGLQALSHQIIQSAEVEAEKRLQESEQSIQSAEIAHQNEMEQQTAKQHQKLQNAKNLHEKEVAHFEKIKKQQQALEKEIIEREKKCSEREELLDKKLHEHKKQHIKLVEKLEEISHFTQEKAKSELLSITKNLVSKDAAKITQSYIEQAKNEGKEKATKIIATTINRLKIPQLSETASRSVLLPNEEIKSRIVGREGRNIRALESATGVNFLLDDVPDTVIVSGFDPMRIEIAKIALQELVLDGRIHPSRIEEVVKKAKEQIEYDLEQEGSKAAQRCGCPDLQKELIYYLGQLSLCRSLGQNVLSHSVEVSHIMRIMAEEIEINAALAARIGLLHDIGKAASHEMEGSHAMIGMTLALKYGESKEVANGIGCHHDEITPSTIEGSLCQTADALSASRPGARIEAVGEYIKRLRRLEEIAFEFPAVEHAYALQAGKELRVAVLPDMIDDAGIINLSRDLTHTIQQRIRYSGKIKVTVVREKQVTSYAG